MSERINLDERLKTIMSLIPAGSVVADVGCDHGYLICALAKAGLIKRGFACDVNPKPLSQAKKTIASHGLSGMVDTVLTNGLNGLEHQQINVFVISGMGGELIAGILLTHDWTRDKNLQFIFQPMTKPERLRRALYKNGFTISFEQAVISDNKLYTVMDVSYTGRFIKYSDVSCYTGLLDDRHDKASRLFLAETLRSIEKKARGLSASKKPDKAKKYMVLAEQLKERIAKNSHDL